MKIVHTASAIWRGSLKDGAGTLTTGSTALIDKPFSYKTRFEGEAGTNPEELLGAAHAGCFSMALSLILGKAGFVPEYIVTTTKITLETKGDSFEITSSHLDVVAKIPNIDDSTFQEIACTAKVACPISKVLRAEITMDATLL